MSQQSKKASPEVTRQIFEKFLDELRNSGVSADVIARLQKVLLEEHSVSEGMIEAALFPDQQES